MQRSDRALALAAVLALTSVTACRHSTRSRHVVRLPVGASLDVDRIRFEPPGHVKALRLDEVGNLSVDTDGTALTARVPESCPISIPSPAAAIAIPLMRVEGDSSQVGFDTTFELTAALGCEEGERGRVEWRQIEGPALAETAVLDGGRKFRARTLPRSHFLPDPLPPGIVAVSPRTQGRYVIEASLLRDGRPPVRRSATVTSIARATGLSSLAVSQRVMLGGSGWHVEHAAPGGRARVEEGGGAATFAPDVAGRWVLADGAGNRLGVQSLTHDRTPLDCGRAECHAAIAAAATSTPMSEALMRPLRSGSAPGCTLECHVTGERGLRDGGFFDVMETMGWKAPRKTVFEELPHALQRLGGVRCTSCHGPGAIPEPGDRHRILRASVCATCHDAPPTYTHVADWTRSAMARADRAVETRAAPCARCHTTGGFLEAIGVRPRPDGSRDPDGTIVGISCAACHAPHGAHVGALVRASTAGSVCVGCHTPAPSETVPSASSALLVEGRLRFPASLGGVEERGPAPHAALPNGCTGCHGASPGKRAGTDHSFRVDRAICASCHPSSVPAEDRTLHERAAQLGARLRKECGAPEVVETPHAHPPSCKLPPERARALYAVTLVSEDSGAAVHNGPLAKRLLDEAEAALRERAP